MGNRGESINFHFYGWESKQKKRTKNKKFTNDQIKLKNKWDHCKLSYIYVGYLYEPRRGLVKFHEVVIKGDKDKRVFGLEKITKKQSKLYKRTWASLFDENE